MLAVLLFCGSAQAAAPSANAQNPPNVAFYYQDDLPIDELQAFDIVVVDPTQVALPKADLAPHTAWFARLDLHAQAGTKSAGEIVSQLVTPLWNKGYRGLLLDDGSTLGEATAKSDQWLQQVMQAIHTEYPQIRLMLRNHLELAQVRAQDLYASVVDSLYYQPRGSGSFLAMVPDSLRASVLQQVKTLQASTGLPVVAIDYCAVNDKQCRRQTASQLISDGVIPFVTAPGMATVGIGRIEVMPRKILLVQVVGAGQPLDETVGVHSIAMPLNYLGYDIQYANINGRLPSGITNDRYAGIVVSVDRAVRNSGVWSQWLLARIREGTRVAVFGQFGFPIDTQTARTLSLEVVPGTAPVGSAPQVVGKSSMMGFEVMPNADIRDAVGIRVDSSGKSLLRLKANQYIYDAAGLTPWGGFSLNPYSVFSLGALGQDRWAIQPIQFLQQALALPMMPVPDVTTENGRRLLFTHVDGDGFASRGEFSGSTGKYSGEILYDQIFTRYKIPMQLSVIEGEMGAAGMYPKLAPILEPIARKMFALPNVEIASHTFSHPFNLEQIDEQTGKRMAGKPNPEWGGDDAFSLDIPHYEFDVNREIKGTIDYINQRLAPPGKSVLSVFWPGDAAAPKIALRRAAQAGVLNINGGDTVITKSKNSWTNIAPYGVAKGNEPDEYQVYASIMNENVYTDDWQGPFYGFDRVLETFEMTNKPIRFKAIDIYYHFYSGTKTASLKALHTIFDDVLKQAVFPIFTTEYIKKVLDWRSVAIAREGNRWIVRSGQNLRELRWSGAGVPDLSSASNVSGYLPGPGGLYIHMGGDQASFTIVPAQTKSVPYIAEASGFVRQFERTDKGMQFEFGGYYKPFMKLNDALGCKVSIDGKSAVATGKTGALQLNVSGNAAKPVAYHLVKVNCE
ncbi:endo alpha-1,4 polygalactosaminidase [Eoetvoesiella caeni]|nr:endo alpha-1,4 polygalactosaminidase [Eoetvoesiella caeni]MCI2810889.1 endo alpha-1,4 polygalactosaminidase [Eoetvoesiella caeni]NYT56812.1 endo alpha-1,4 polygalactosaminidase [Eoetvoesiella caeni]